MDLLVDTNRELDRVSEQLTGTNPELYRHLALYLQVLRHGLLNSVQQACFYVATQVDPQRYLELPRDRRSQLHLRLVNLVSRANSLLTVEQLCQLAGQLHRNRGRSQRNRQQKLMEVLQSQAENEALPPTSSAGSVHLGLALPLGRNFLGEAGFAGLIPTPVGETDRDNPDQLAGQPGDPSPLDQPGALEAMAAAFGEAFAGFDGHEDPQTPWDGGLLPGSPTLLLRWLDGYEQALIQRLRNLSHAVNVELLRQGISSSLLPVSLLDAVLQGQMDPLTAPANVLRLQLPFMDQEMAPTMESTAVLLRLADLELEQPKLRTCRSRLQQHRQEVRRMAQQYRRLERRVQALEAERLWLQDISTARKP